MKLISVLVVLAGTAAVAAAAPGATTYTQGNIKTGSGVRMTVKDGRFAIQVVRFREHCRYGDRDFTEYFTFKAGSRAHPAGPVKPDGTFRGVYTPNANRVVATGTISGATATIKVTEQGLY